MRRPNSIIACTTALVLTGCALATYSETDVSVIRPESNRTAIENELGEPDAKIKSGADDLFIYNFGTGFSSLECPSGDVLAYSTLGILATPGCARRGHIVIAYADEGKPVYSSRLAENAGVRKQQVADLARLYALAQQGDVDALYRLGKIGLVLEHRRHMFEQAAAAGNMAASYELGIISSNNSDAIKWLREAAEGGHPPAQAELGNRYLTGKGVPRDFELARTLLTKAAMAGEVSAQTALGTLETAIEKDKLSGVILAQLQADADGGDLKSQLELAERYRFGRDVPMDLQQAIRWYVRAAEYGGDFAPYALGNIHADGETGVVNPSQAYKWYSISEAAASDGTEDLRRRKRELIKIMSPDKIAEAERLARDWLAAHL